MLIKKAPDIRSSEITPKSLYLRRREFIQASAAALVAAGCGSLADEVVAQGGGLAKLPNVKKSPLSTTETPSLYDHVTSYNNFYEFETGAGDGPKNRSKNFKARPWKIQIDGLVNKPGSYDIDEFMKPYALEERIYRMRCVEAWSFVIPWVGIPMADVIKRVEPTSKATFVEFTTLHDVGRFPMQRTDALEWPYIEGLRLDEAQHPLTLLAVGIYGEVLPAQNGAPIRLVVPWKYGFKGAKSLARIRFVEKQPRQHLAGDEAERVRLLRQRQSTGGSPALEPGAREAAAQLHRQPPDRDVQRLRRSGAEPVHGHGLAQEFLKPITLVKVVLFAAACLPAAALVYGFYQLYYGGDFNALTANPGDYITDQTGTWALGCLAAALCVTPIRRLTGWNEFIKVRRMIGLFAFFYAVLHMLTWVVFIHYFDVKFMIEDVVKRPFITVGMTTFLILFVLALTSNRFSIRKLGRKWGKLHRLVYVAAIGGTLHFWQLVKADTTEPWRWAWASPCSLGFVCGGLTDLAWRRGLQFPTPNSQRPTTPNHQLPRTPKVESC